MAASESALFGRLMAGLADDPAGFNKIVLGRTHESIANGYWHKQVEVLRSTLTNRYTVVPAGHGCGKSYLASGAALHFAYTRPNSRVLLFGPTFPQLQEVLWGELADAWQKSRIKLPGRLIGGNSPKLLLGEKWGIWGSSVGGDGVSKAGRHAGRMLIVADEACSEGYDDLIEDLEGLNASNYLFIGNPLRDGRFKSLCDMADAGRAGYEKISISSLESPHAHLDRSPVGLADKGYLEMMRSTYGEDSPQWRARVLGIFNDEDEFALIPNAWLDRCTTPHTNQEHGPLTLAVDLSKGTGRGDSSVIIVRDNDSLIFMDSSTTWKFPEGVGERVKQIATEYKIPGNKIIYDSGGLGEGFGFVLSSHFGLPGAYGYVGGETGGRLATNFRGASALALKNRLDPSRNSKHFYIPQKYIDILKPQIAELRYELAGRDQIKLEPKEKLKGRLGRSPDHLDCLIQSFCR